MRRRAIRRCRGIASIECHGPTPISLSRKFDSLQPRSKKQLPKTVFDSVAGLAGDCSVDCLGDGDWPLESNVARELAYIEKLPISESLGVCKYVVFHEMRHRRARVFDCVGT